MLCFRFRSNPVLLSGMFRAHLTTLPSSVLRLSALSITLLASIAAPAHLIAQASTPAPSMRDRIMARIMGSGSSAWTPEQLATMAKLRDAAIADDYALTELHHLTDNIGPRLSGSPQAQQAVEYVADEMRALGAEVTLEKTAVPHWVRGLETGSLLEWKGMAPG